MPTDKQTILALAVQELNQPGQPWQASIEGDTIVARWRWMDANLFGLVTITNEVRDYTFTVTLRDNGTWKEHDATKDRTLSIGLTGGSGKFSWQSGHTTAKAFEFGIGQNNQTGSLGPQQFVFDTDLIKRPIRDWLTAHGWRKAGLFG